MEEAGIKALRNVAAQGRTVNAHQSAKLQAWRVKAEATLIDTCGEGHLFVKKFRQVPWSPTRGMTLLGYDPAEMMARANHAIAARTAAAREAGLETSIALLEAAADYLEGKE